MGAIRKSRIGLLQIIGPEQKEHMNAYGAETPDEEVGLIYGRLEHLLDTSAKIAGLTQRQYRDWVKLEFFETGPKSGRGRSQSKRRKVRKEKNEEADRETSAAQRDRQRKVDEEKRKKETQAKRDVEKQEKEERKKNGKKRVSGTGMTEQQKR